MLLCRSNTQSEAPELLLPVGVKTWVPVLGNGEPETVEYDPLRRIVPVGIPPYGPANFVISTVMLLDELGMIRYHERTI